MENLGLYIIGAAIIGFIISRLNSRNVSSRSGGISVGGDNFGKIKLVNKDTKKDDGFKTMELIFGLIGVVGVIFTIWPLK